MTQNDTSTTGQAMSDHQHVVQTGDEGTAFCIVCELQSRLREAEQEKMVAVEIRRWAFKWMKKAEAERDQLREQYKALDRDFNECDSERDRLQEELREVKDDRDTLWAEREELAEAVDERDRLQEAIRKQLSMMTDPAALPYLREALEGTSDE